MPQISHPHPLDKLDYTTREELERMTNSIISQTSSWPPFSQNKDKKIERVRNFKNYLDNFKEFLEFVDENYVESISGKLLNRLENDYKDIPELNAFIEGIIYVKDERQSLIKTSDELYDLLASLETQADSAISRLQSETDNVRVTNEKRMSDSWQTWNTTPA